MKSLEEFIQLTSKESDFAEKEMDLNSDPELATALMLMYTITTFEKLKAQALDAEFKRLHERLDKLESPVLEVRKETDVKDKNGTNLKEGDYFSNIQADVNMVIDYDGKWCYTNYHAGALPLDDGTEKVIVGNRIDNPEMELDI